MTDKCGCGRPVKYNLATNEPSCNKYSRCPTYGVLEENSAILYGKYLLLLRHATSLLHYREGTKYYEKARKFLEELNEEDL